MAVIRSASEVAMESVFSFNVNANDAAWTWAARAWAFPNACSCLHISLPGDWKTLGQGYRSRFLVSRIIGYVCGVCACACVVEAYKSSLKVFLVGVK